MDQKIFNSIKEKIEEYVSEFPELEDGKTELDQIFEVIDLLSEESYESGKSDGYGEGKNDGEYSGYQRGKDYGYNEGYNQGLYDGERRGGALWRKW